MSWPLLLKWNYRDLFTNFRPSMPQEVGVLRKQDLRWLWAACSGRPLCCCTPSWRPRELLVVSMRTTVFSVCAPVRSLALTKQCRQLCLSVNCWSPLSALGLALLAARAGWRQSPPDTVAARYWCNGGRAARASGDVFAATTTTAARPIQPPLHIGYIAQGQGRLKSSTHNLGYRHVFRFKRQQTIFCILLFFFYCYIHINYFFNITKVVVQWQSDTHFK